MEQPDPFRLVVPQSALDAFVAHARSELPNECCGFFAGRIEDGIGRVTAYLPLVNELASPTEFTTEARSVLAAFRVMRAEGTDVLAVCHSHPSSDPVPSWKDIERNTYGPTVAWAIIGLKENQPTVRVWWLTGSGFREASWIVAPLGE